MSSFIMWLEKEMKDRNWKQADLARAANLDSSVVSMLLNGRRKPGEVTCNAIARAFDIPPEDVFRAAGILPPNREKPPGLEEWIYLYVTASEPERQEMLEYAHFKKQRRPANSRSG
jgi:transcriptional regulator with XRE-family HTH domain